MFSGKDQQSLLKTAMQKTSKSPFKQGLFNSVLVFRKKYYSKIITISQYSGENYGKTKKQVEEMFPSHYNILMQN